MSDPTPPPDPLDQVVEEFLDQLRRGERPNVDAFAARHPGLADDIRETFPVLLAMEQAKPEAAAALGPHPAVVGDYRIVRWVGGGGMGDVYEAVQTSLGRRVALKILRSSGRTTPESLERFRREARAAAKFHHTNIVPVFDSGEQHGRLYYAMQFIQGKGLDAVLDDLRRVRADERPGPLDSVSRGVLTGSFAPTLPAAGATHPAPPRPDPTAPAAAASSWAGTTRAGFYRGVARLGADAASALAHAHRANVLHRDVKPSNLLVDDGGQVWVTDFGLAKTADGANLTGTGDLLGTLRYMAPERFDGVAGPAADVYGLGLTLYELLTLRPAYDGPADQGLVRRILSDTPPRPAALDPRIPLDLETIVLKATARRADDRYATAADMADDLARFLADKPVLARRATLVERGWRACRRNPTVTSAVAAVLATAVVGAAGSGWFAWQSAGHADAARTQSAKAKDQADKARAALRTLVDGVIGRELGRRAELTAEETAFFETVLRQYEDAFSDEELEGGTAVAEGYYGVARLQAMLGRSVDAGGNYQAAIDRLDPRLAAAPDDVPARDLRLKCLNNLAGLHTRAGRHAEAERLHVRCLDDAVAVAAADPARTDRKVLVLRARSSLALARKTTARPDEVVRTLVEAVAEAEAEHARTPDDRTVLICLVSLHLDLAGQREAGREFDAAIASLHRAAELCAAVRDDPNSLNGSVELTGRALGSLAALLRTTGRHTQALDAARRAVELTGPAAAAYPHSDVVEVHAAALLRRGLAREDGGDLRGAEEDYAEALAHAEACRKRFQTTSDDAQVLFADAATNLARARRVLNPGIDATPLYRRAEAAVAEVVARNPDGHARRKALIELLFDAVNHLAELNRVGQADALLAQLTHHVGELRRRAPADPEGSLYRTRLLIGGARQLADTGRTAEARAGLADATALLDAAADPSPHHRELRANALTVAALAAYRDNDPATAGRELGRAVGLLRDALMRDPGRHQTRKALAAALAMAGLTPDAAREIADVLEPVPDHLLDGKDRWVYASAMNELANRILQQKPEEALALLRRGSALEPVAEPTADELGLRTILGGMLVNSSIAHAAMNRPDLAREPLDRAVRVLTEAYESPVGNKAFTLQYLTNALRNRVGARVGRNEFAAALADLDRVAALAGGKLDPQTQGVRAVCLAGFGKPGEAAGVATDLMADAAASPETLYAAAVALAVSSDAASLRPADRGQYRKRAVECLARAARRGGDAPPAVVARDLETNAQWKALRDEPEFQELVCELSAADR